MWVDYFLRFDETAWSTQDSTIQDDNGDAEVSCRRRGCLSDAEVIRGAVNEVLTAAKLIHKRLTENFPLPKNKIMVRPKTGLTDFL